MNADSEVRRQSAGNFVNVEPGGQSLIVVVRESPNTKLVRVPLNGGPAQEIRVPGPLTLGYMIDSDSVRNGRLLAPGAARPSIGHPPFSISPQGNPRAFHSNTSATSIMCPGHPMAR